MTYCLPAHWHDRAWTLLLASGFLALGAAMGAYFIAGLFLTAVEPGFAAANPGVETWYHRFLAVMLGYFALALAGAFLLDQRVERRPPATD